jgi:hypothetical protein
MNTTADDCLKVNVSEPLVAKDLYHSFFDSHPVDWILLKKFLYKVFQFFRQVNIRRKLYLLSQYRMVDLLGIVRVERRKACDELVEEGSEAVTVDKVVMSNFQEHFWRHILRRPAK